MTSQEVDSATYGQNWLNRRAGMTAAALALAGVVGVGAASHGAAWTAEHLCAPGAAVDGIEAAGAVACRTAIEIAVEGLDPVLPLPRN